MPGRTGGAVPITTARRSLTEDVASRTHRYLLIMGIRTLCFVLAVTLTDGWVRWVCIVGAVVLPQVAVILANGGRENFVAAPEPYVAGSRPALEAGPGTARDGTGTLG